MLKLFKIMFPVMMSAVLLAACATPSFEKESADAVKEAKTIANDSAKKPNTKSGNIHVYLPFGFKIKEQSPNNILLKNGSRLYILFVNTKEKASSEVVYKASVAQYKTLRTNEKFKVKNKLGFVLIAPVKDDLYELTAGIGGTKITAETKGNRLKEDAKSMMQIVNSVKVDQ